MEALKLPDGRVVAHVDGCRLVKRVRKSVHMLRVPPGWCIDKAILGQAEAAGVHTIEVCDLESGTRYIADIGALRRYGRLINRGHGDQWLLPLDHWQVIQPGQPVQLSLALEGAHG